VLNGGRGVRIAYGEALASPAIGHCDTCLRRLLTICILVHQIGPIFSILHRPQLLKSVHFSKIII